MPKLKLYVLNYSTNPISLSIPLPVNSIPKSWKQAIWGSASSSFCSWKVSHGESLGVDVSVQSRDLNVVLFKFRFRDLWHCVFVLSLFLELPQSISDCPDRNVAEIGVCNWICFNFGCYWAAVLTTRFLFHVQIRKAGLRVMCEPQRIRIIGALVFIMYWGVEVRVGAVWTMDTVQGADRTHGRICRHGAVDGRWETWECTVWGVGGLRWCHPSVLSLKFGCHCSTESGWGLHAHGTRSCGNRFTSWLWGWDQPTGWSCLYVGVSVRVWRWGSRACATASNLACRTELDESGYELFRYPWYVSGLDEVKTKNSSSTMSILCEPEQRSCLSHRVDIVYEPWSKFYKAFLWRRRAFLRGRSFFSSGKYQLIDFCEITSRAYVREFGVTW